MADSACAHTSAHPLVPFSSGPVGIEFKPTGWKGYAYSVDGTLPASGALLTIHATARLGGEIDMSALISGISCCVRFTAADARAVAAELLAAADSVDAARTAGRA